MCERRRVEWSPALASWTEPHKLRPVDGRICTSLSADSSCKIMQRRLNDPPSSEIDMMSSSCFNLTVDVQFASDELA